MRTLLARLPERATAIGALVLTSALWGSNAVVARDLLGSLSPAALTWLRWLVFLSLLGPLVWKERAAIVRALREHPGALTLFALIGFAPQNLLTYSGLARSSAINFGVLNSAIPVMIFALLAWRTRRMPTRLEGAGLALSIAGVLLIIARGDVGALARLQFSGADLAILLGMGVWSVYTIKLAARTIPLSFPAFCFAAGLIGFALLAPAVAYDAWARGLPRLTPGTLAGVAYIGALPSLAATLLYGYGVARVGPAQAGVFTHLVPVFGSLLAVALIGEHLHAYHAVGFAFVAGGALLCCLRPAPAVVPTTRSA
ncbi:MAG: DMT family transporter [Proteobacteria bacterium]|nr:DMT family transporter [Pseudomonadota bacterium]